MPVNILTQSEAKGHGGKAQKNNKSQWGKTKGISKCINLRISAAISGKNKINLTQLQHINIKIFK